MFCLAKNASSSPFLSFDSLTSRHSIKCSDFVPERKAGQNLQI